MKIGVGGKAGQFRGGISNKGVGVGIGPVRAGTSFKSRKGGGGCLGQSVGVLFFICVLAANWKVLLPVVGVVGVVWFLIAALIRARSVQAHERAGTPLAQALAKSRDWQNNKPSQVRRGRVTQDEEVCDRRRKFPRGTPSPSVPPGEKLLGRFSDVFLIAPEASKYRRSGPLVVVDHGAITITDVAVRFSGSTEEREWLLDDLSRAHAPLRFQGQRLLLPARDGQPASGIEAPARCDIAMTRTLLWALSLRTGAEYTREEADLDQLVAGLASGPLSQRDPS